MEVLSVNVNNGSSVDFSKSNVWDYIANLNVDDEDDEDVPSGGLTTLLVAQRLEEELRVAKRDHLSCGEVLLPCDLLERIASSVVATSETEPCGVRGCTLYLTFEGEDANCRKLGGAVQFDPTTASTFELYLTLKQSTAGWNSFLPQFLKKIARGGTVMISPDFELRKKKLYRSYID